MSAGTMCSRPVRAASVCVAALALAPFALADASGKGEAETRAACTSFGPSWAHSYNKAAVKSGNPVRIVSACCKQPTRPGVHSCYVTVTLAGTKDRGCESVDIGKSGLPVGPGKHENCLLHKP